MNLTIHYIADSHEMGKLGIYHLKRLRSKLIYPNQINNDDPTEAALDNALMDILGLGYLPTYTFVFQHRPSFQEFEEWVVNHYPTKIPKSIIDQCNALFNVTTTKQIKTADDTLVLSAEDLLHWDEFGYVIVREAITPEDCEETCKLIWDFLGLDENNPESWYQTQESIQGIMVNLFNHPIIHKNRHVPRIRNAYEQIWGTPNLIVTADKVGFNPPQTPNYKFKGNGLHFDTSLATPIPFGTQGILYLTDTAANQGALTLVPSFHHNIHNWLQQLEPHKNPREQNFFQFGAKPIAANAGDFIIWHHCLPHSASPNNANKPRLVQYINWYNPLVVKQSKWI